VTSARSSARGARRGLTVVEVVLSVVLGCTVLGAGLATIAMSNDVARSSAADDAASRVVARVLRSLTDDVRRASRDTLMHLDGTDFADGTTDTGVSFQHVVGYRGTTLLGPVVVVRFDSVTGDVIRTQGGVSETIARKVTSLQIERDGNRLTFTAVCHRGPTDARGRRSSASSSVHVRNP
jgi:hypothetical protein